MPNYCYNKLTIRGKSLDVKKFYEENVINEELSFNKSVTCSHKNWHEERCAKWGTKGDAVDTRIISNRFDKGIFVCDFLTAWSPPIFWFEKISEKYSMLSFILSWNEPGCFLKGSISCKKGEITKYLDIPKTNYDHVVKSIKKFHKKIIASNFKTEEQYFKDVFQDFTKKVVKLKNNLSYNTVSRAEILLENILKNIILFESFREQIKIERN